MRYLKTVSYILFFILSFSFVYAQDNNVSSPSVSPAPVPFDGTMVPGVQPYTQTFPNDQGGNGNFFPPMPPQNGSMPQGNIFFQPPMPGGQGGQMPPNGQNGKMMPQFGEPRFDSDHKFDADRKPMQTSPMREGDEKRMMNGGDNNKMMKNREGDNREDDRGGQKQDNRQGQFSGGENNQNNHSASDGKRIDSEVGRFEKEFKRGDKIIQNLKNKGIEISQECKDNFQKTADSISSIKSTEDVDEKMSKMQDMMMTMDDLNDCKMKIEMLTASSKIFKQADSELKKLRSALAKMKKKALKSTLDLSSVIASFEDEINKIDSVRQAAKETLKTDPEEAIQSIRDDFFGEMDVVWEWQKVFDQIIQLKKFFKTSEQQLKTKAKEISALKKKKIDTAEIQGIYDQAKEQLAKIKSLTLIKPINIDDVDDAMQDFFEFIRNYEDLKHQLDGKEDTGDIPGFDFKGFDISSAVINAR